MTKPKNAPRGAPGASTEALSGTAHAVGDTVEVSWGRGYIKDCTICEGPFVRNGSIRYRVRRADGEELEVSVERVRSQRRSSSLWLRGVP